MNGEAVAAAFSDEDQENVSLGIFFLLLDLCTIVGAIFRPKQEIGPALRIWFVLKTMRKTLRST